MKKILSILALIIIISGCGLNQDANNSNTESNTKSSSESTQDSSKMTNLDSHLTVAKQALSAGDYAQAIEEATASIKDNPNNADAYSVRGFAMALNGDTTKGIADTKKAYDLDPNNVANYYNMAMVYKLQGQLPESKRWFEKVLEKDPSNTWSVYGIATIYADQGDDTKALDWLEKAINIDASVKAVAAEQDHFERFHNNERFKTLVGLQSYKTRKDQIIDSNGIVTMDSKQMIRLILKVVGFIYWFVFLYLGGLMVMDWSGFMSQHNIETPLFLTYLVFVGCFVTPYIMLYWKKLNPNAKAPFWVRHLSEYMARLEDRHSIWFDVLYVLKLMLYFVIILWMLCIILLTLAVIAWTVVLILLSN